MLVVCLLLLPVDLFCSRCELTPRCFLRLKYSDSLDYEGERKSRKQVRIFERRFRRLKIQRRLLPSLLRVLSFLLFPETINLAPSCFFSVGRSTQAKCDREESQSSVSLSVRPSVRQEAGGKIRGNLPSDRSRPKLATVDKERPFQSLRVSRSIFFFLWERSFTRVTSSTSSSRPYGTCRSILSNFITRLSTYLQRYRSFSTAGCGEN